MKTMNEQQQELNERIADDERHAATMRKARDYDALAARVEAAEVERNTAARRAFNAEADSQRLTAENRRLAARVAELEVELAAQGWRPGSETPKHDWYLVYDFSEDDQPLVRYYGPTGWRLSGDRVIPNWYMPIPPLPPAPQETE
jgi:hypothetical protein